MKDVIWLALGLVLVIEGLLPFLNPGSWRRFFEQALKLSDDQVRIIGLLSILIGLALIWGLG
jgi:uncharacterized protein YjeT (DUF2065 family)